MNDSDPQCRPVDHALANPSATYDDQAYRSAAELMRALGDAARLRILLALRGGEMCVTEIAERMHDNLPSVSQRLKLLRASRLVDYRREGKHVFYRLADDHVAKLVTNALEHVCE